MSYYFVTLKWRRNYQGEWSEQNDIIDVHPLAYLRSNIEASERAMKLYKEYQAGTGPWQKPTEPEKYLLVFAMEISKEEYLAHRAFEDREQ